MAILRKVPQEKDSKDLEEERLRFILGGGIAKADVEDSTPEKKKEEPSDGYKYHSLRMPTDMMKKVDETRAKRAGITRTVWILEAIQEKLRKECK